MFRKRTKIKEIGIFIRNVRQIRKFENLLSNLIYFMQRKLLKMYFVQKEIYFYGSFLGKKIVCKIFYGNKIFLKKLKNIY